MICGTRITLRPATQNDRRDIYRWLTASDVTAAMMGPPTFPDVPIPTWGEFCEDYAPHFFDRSRPHWGCSFIIEVNGKAVGHINYDGLDTERSIAELDIWLRSQDYCGHGYGTDAMVALMRHLHANFAVETFIVRPSRRNQRAICAYEKTGFRPSQLAIADQVSAYGNGDYADTITLECKISP
ncbi:MAG: GNAT family N-acetyltransferase [Chloroflexota bacterium]